MQSVTPLAASPVAATRSCAVFVCAFVRPLRLRWCRLAMLQPQCDFPLGLLERRLPGQQKQIVTPRHWEKKLGEKDSHLQSSSVVDSACLERIRYVPAIERQLRPASNSDRPRITLLRRNCRPACVARAGQSAGHVSRLALLLTAEAEIPSVPLLRRVFMNEISGRVAQCGCRLRRPYFADAFRISQ